METIVFTPNTLTVIAPKQQGYEVPVHTVYYNLRLGNRNLTNVGSSTSTSIGTTTLNPGNITFQNPVEVFSIPMFVQNVEVTLGGKIFITFVEPFTLNIGEHTGAITFRCFGKLYELPITYRVIVPKRIKMSPKEVFFCLDKDPIHVDRSTNAHKFEMRLTMQMKSNSLMPTNTIVQTYEYLSYRPVVDVYPGDEINSFFETNYATSYFITRYYATKVQVEIIEYNAQNEIITYGVLHNLYFLPGKTPKAFPFLTNGTKRRIYDRSKIAVSALYNSPDLAHFISKDDGPTAPTIPPIADPNSWENYKVMNWTFERLDVIPSGVVYRETTIDFVSVPMPNGSQNIIHLFFENQNRVMDWFSCVGEVKFTSEFSHLQDETTGQKFGSLETQTPILHTGFILKEEIPLINELIKSNECVIQIGEEFYKAKPISQKNEIYDTEKHLYAMEIEFEIKRNAR